MDINRANMQSLFTGYNILFRDAYAAAVNTDYQQFSMEMSMGTSKLEMPLLQQLTGMRQWLGPREIKNVATEKLTIVPRSWEDTVGVERDDVEDDNYGVYHPIISQMAVNAANLGSDLVDDLLSKAAAEKWLDGGNFFSTTRKYGKTSVINNLGTAALSYDSFNTAYDAMRTYKGHGGQSLRVKPSILIHGPALRTTAADLILSDKRLVTVESTGVTVLGNPNQNKVKLLELEGITDNKWFLAAANGAYKPVCVFMRRRPDNLVRKDRENDDNVFFENKFVYGSSGRAEAAFVLPHLIYFGNVTG